MSFPLFWIPLLPLLGAAVLMLFGRRLGRNLAPWVAIAAVGVSLIVVLDGFIRVLPHAGSEGLVDRIGTWFGAGPLSIELAFRMDALSGVMCLVVTFVGFLIHVYAAGYMRDDPDVPRFFAYMNLFTGAMLILVLADSLPVMFVGWEGVGLCSYLLIGFWYSNRDYASAGRKAFVVNRIGDLGFLMGMFLLFQATGTMRMPEITTAATAGGALTEPLWGMNVAFWAGVALFWGAAGKSAQLPLYVWLPDAMAGPTPVSALIHAATMVTAGVYMIARLNAVYLLAPAALAIVALVGAATALFAAIIGFAQNDFKKVLAYSTISQLGFMFAGVGTANFGGGVFHLVTHAFFKAGLFLCAGSVMHAMGGLGDIARMGGLRKKLPWTHAVFWVCWLAIAGVPLFSGFFSKDAIIAGAFGGELFERAGLHWVGTTVGVTLLAAALGTAFYMSRLYYLVFSGVSRAGHEVDHHVHESPRVMVIPLVVLAAGAALAGLIGLPGGLLGNPHLNVLGSWFAPVLGAEAEIPHSIETAFMLVSTVLAIAGILAARAFYLGGWRRPAVAFAAAFPRLVALVRDKFRIDELYRLLIVRPLAAISRGTFALVDRVLIDRVMVEGPAMIADGAGRALRTVQNGVGQRYLAVFVIGVAGLLWFASRPVAAGEIQLGVTGGRTVVVDVARAASPASPAGTVYRYDFDGDGKFEAETGNPRASYTYPRPGKYQVKVEIHDRRWGSSTTLLRKVEVQ